MYQQVVSSLAHLNDSTEDQQSTTIQVFASSLFTQVDGQLQLMTQNSDDKNVVDHEFSETVLDNENQSLDCSHELDDQRWIAVEFLLQLLLSNHGAHHQPM